MGKIKPEVFKMKNLLIGFLLLTVIPAFGANPMKTPLQYDIQAENILRNNGFHSVKEITVSRPESIITNAVKLLVDSNNEDITKVREVHFTDYSSDLVMKYNCLLLILNDQVSKILDCTAKSTMMLNL